MGRTAKINWTARRKEKGSPVFRPPNVFGETVEPLKDPPISCFHCLRPPLRRCASASDTPCARERGAWLQADQSVPRSKCVRRASHGLDGKAATLNVWKRVAAEEHQVRITLVDPKGDFCFAVRIAELHTSEAIRIPLKVRKTRGRALASRSVSTAENRIRLPPRLPSGSEGRARRIAGPFAQVPAKSNRR